MSEAHLLGSEGGAQGADGLRVFRALLFQLQELGCLDQGLQGPDGPAWVQVLPSQPLLQLADVKPAPNTNKEETGYGESWPEASESWREVCLFPTGPRLHRAAMEASATSWRAAVGSVNKAEGIPFLPNFSSKFRGPLLFGSTERTVDPLVSIGMDSLACLLSLMSRAERG